MSTTATPGMEKKRKTPDASSEEDEKRLPLHHMISREGVGLMFYIGGSDGKIALCQDRGCTYANDRALKKLEKQKDEPGYVPLEEREELYRVYGGNGAHLGYPEMETLKFGESSWTVPGLHVFPQFISLLEEKGFLSYLYDTWENPRYQRSNAVREDSIQYGICFRWFKGDPLFTDEAPPIPPWLRETVRRVQDMGRFQLPINQVVVGSFDRGDETEPYVEDANAYGPQVAVLILNHAAPLYFESEKSRQRFSVDAPQRSLLTMSEKACYKWKRSWPMITDRKARITVKFCHVFPDQVERTPAKIHSKVIRLK